MARAWSIMSLSRYLVALIAGIGVVVTAAAVFIFFQINESRNAWSTYQHASAARARALNELVGAFGYGGMIHQFKNYVLRNEHDRVLKISSSANRALDALHDLEAQTPTDEEQAALDDIKSTIHNYLDAVGRAQTSFVFGGVPEDIDKEVKISDGAALAGLELLFHTIEDEELGGVESKTRYLIMLKRALGYGGMIHEFKNYVLRQDAPRVAKINAQIAEARTALEGFRKFELSSAEMEALQNIEIVISSYENGTRLVSDLAENGKTATEIDREVKVKDGPALKALETLSDAQVLETRNAEVTLESYLARTQTIAMIAIGFVAFSSILLGLVTSHILLRKIARPARDIAGILGKLSVGDTEIDVSDMLHDTEIGEIARAAEVFRENLLLAKGLEEEQMKAADRERELLEESIQKEKRERDAAEEHAKEEAVRLREMEAAQKELNELISHAVNGDFSHRANIQADSSNLAGMMKAINRMMSEIETSLDEAGRVLGELSVGNLTTRMEGEYQGVFATLQDNMNTSLQILEDMVEAVASSGSTVAKKSDDIRVTATDLAQRTEGSAASLEEAAAALEEISSTVTSVSENIERVSTSALEAEKNAQTTSDVAERAVSSLDQASQTTQNIEKIVSVIEDIAFQINLLALNAGVEAARAGESGRGFAVVASEVRALAQRSSEAVGEITTVINDSTQAVGNSVSMVAEAMDKVTEISNSIGTISRQTSEAAEAVNQQAKGLVSISETITDLDAATQVNSSLFVEVRENSEHLRSQAGSLENALGKLTAQSSATQKEGIAPGKGQAAIAAE